MPRSFLIKKKSDRESAAERFNAGYCCDDEDVGDKDVVTDQPCPPSQDFAPLRNGKQDPEINGATVLVPARRTTIWSPAAELHVGANKTSSVIVSPASGLTPFTPLSVAAAANTAFLHPQGNTSALAPSIYRNDFRTHFVAYEYVLTLFQTIF